MLSRHAHSTHTASDARGARARRCADRMEMGRRTGSDALLRSPHAGRHQNGALRRSHGYGSTLSRSTPGIFFVLASYHGAVGSPVQHARDRQPAAGRVDREHWRRRASERFARASASARPQSLSLRGWETHRERAECDFALAGRSTARRAYDRCGSHRSPRRAAAKQRAGDVPCSTDVDRESARWPCAAQSASTTSGPHEQQTAFPAAVLYRLERCTHRDRRPADESSSSQTALVDRALRTYRASTHARCIRPSLTTERLRW